MQAVKITSRIPLTKLNTCLSKAPPETISRARLSLPMVRDNHETLDAFLKSGMKARRKRKLIE